MSSFIEKLTRKKYVSFDTSPLPRVLNLFDLIALGVGSTVGVGFYILAGEVARNTAGPAVIVSFLIAGIASVFSAPTMPTIFSSVVFLGLVVAGLYSLGRRSAGLLVMLVASICYAEFGARVPKAGSAYVYSYVCVGEFIAFVIGWNLILEYVIGTASVARGYSAYIDDLANNKISEAFNNSMHMNVDALSPYPDFFALGMTFLLAVILIIGVKESSRFNNIFTGVNMFVIIYVIIAGGTQADIYNWNLTEEDVRNNSICTEAKAASWHEEESPWGTGGFVPYGFNGIMHGAATCFFGFVGFDIIATTGEEALRPERNIPLSISISLLVVFMAYFGMSAVLTLALPYCMEDPDAPLIELFEAKDMEVSKWIVSIGAIFGFSASLLGAMFPMPRIIYAMADDGLLFRFLSRINKKFKTPAIATVLSGILAGVMALLFDLGSLVDMMSIGTLMAYTIVSVCVMLLRYSVDNTVNAISSEYTLLKYTPDNETDFMSIEKDPSKQSSSKKNLVAYSSRDYIGQLMNKDKIIDPTPLTSSIVNYSTLSFCFFCFLLALFLSIFEHDVAHGEAGAIVLVVIFFLLTIINLVIISFQPTSSKVLSFKVPYVPWLPAVSAFINLYLMCNLSSATWIRFAVWMVIGLAIYFFYGIKESSGSEAPARPTIIVQDNEGMEGIEMDQEKIPPIVIQPPTPWGSLLGTPTSTVRPPEPRRTSIIDSPLVQEQPIEPVFIVGGKDSEKGKKSKEQSNSQSFDMSPPKLESLEETSSDSGSDDEDIVAPTKVVTAATVYSSHDSKDDCVIKQEKANELTSTSETGALSTDSRSHPQEDPDYKTKTPMPEVFVFESDDKKPETVPTLDKSTGNTSEIKNDKIVQEADISYQLKDEAADHKQNPLRIVLSDPEIFHEYDISKSHSTTYPTGSVSNSVPGSPHAKKRHPHKVLVRASSFDNIPPSSPDSSLARRVKNFIIIPVSVPNKGEKGSETTDLTEGDDRVPPPTEEASPKINFPIEYMKEDNINMLSDLKSKLTKLEKHIQPYEVTDSSNAQGVGKSPPIEPSSLGPLDIIRERGESKIQLEDVNLVTKIIPEPDSTSKNTESDSTPKNTEADSTPKNTEPDSTSKNAESNSTSRNTSESNRLPQA